MSETQSSAEASTRTALGCRDNFFDHDDEDYELDTDGDTETDDSDYIDPSPGPGAAVLREQWTIDHYLRKHPEAQLFCPYCWHELEAESVLTAPEDYVPESEVVTDPRYRLDPDEEHPEDPTKRHPEAPTESENVTIDDLDYGTKLNLWTESKYGDHRRHRSCENCGGVSWGGVLGDLTTDQFLAAIDEYLGTKRHLSERNCDRVRAEARKRKQGGMADRDNRTQIAYHVAAGLAEEA